MRSRAPRPAGSTARPARRISPSCSRPRAYCCAASVRRPRCASPATNIASAPLRKARRPALAGSGLNGPWLAMPRVQALQRARMRPAEPAAQRFARGADRVGIDVAADLARDVGLAGQLQRQRGEGGVDAAGERVVDDGAIGGDEGGVDARRAAVADRLPPSASADRPRASASDCQRLNGSLSRLSSARWSASVRSSSTFTGAEKPRSAESAGRRATLAKVMRAARRLQREHGRGAVPARWRRRRRAAGRRVRRQPARAARGSSPAAFPAGRGVGASVCVNSTRKVCAASS